MFKEEGYKLMGAAFEVYNQLGYGMAEEVYQQSLEIELTLQNIPFQSKLNYLRIARQPVGYLINFGHKGSLEWKRFILSELHQPRQPQVKDGEH